MPEAIDRGAGIQERIRTLLDDERRRLHEEIRGYPTPIPRCDQQFNYLIDRRDLLASELARLDAAGSAAQADDRGAWLEAFIDSSACLDAGARSRLKAALHQEPAVESHAAGS